MHLTIAARNAAYAIVATTLLTLASPLLSGAQPAETNAVGPGDQKFVTQAIAAGDQEIAEGEAMKNSSDPSVAYFANRMIKDHTAANAEIGAVAKELGLKTPPLNPKAPAQAMTPAAYMQKEVQDHQQAIALFKGEMGNAGGSQQLRTAAAQAMPALQAHLQMAQQYVSTGKITPVATPTP